VSDFPTGTPDEPELFLRWLAFLRGAVLRKAGGITDEQARWRPDGKLLPLLGLVNHLTHVEWRWIDGEMLGRPTGRSADEYFPGPELTIEAAIPGTDDRGRDPGVPRAGRGDGRRGPRAGRPGYAVTSRRRHGSTLRPHPLDQRDGPARGSRRRGPRTARRYDGRMS
jgi:hypothetical protein